MMKILVLLLCSCVFAVPLGEQQEEALAELLQKVLEADPLENDIGLDDSLKKDVSTPINNVSEIKNDVIVNATELLNLVDSALKTDDESNHEKPVTIVGEIILDPTPDEDTRDNEPVTEFESDLGTNALTGTLIIDTITADEKPSTELEVPDKQTQIDEPADESLSYDELDTPERIPLNRTSLNTDWIIKPSLNRFSLFKPINTDYDDHFTKLENPFLSPLDTLPMDQTFFESTTNADYDVASPDYPFYDDIYDDDQTTEVMANDTNMENDELPSEDDGIQDPIDDTNAYENDQTNVEDPEVLTSENPDAGISEQQSIDINQTPAYNTDDISNSDTDSTVPLYPNRFENDMKGDFDYTDDQTPNYPLDNHPDFDSNYHPYNLGDNMENEHPDLIRFNARGPFHAHYYDTYDKYINIGDIKNFNPYMFYPKRYDGYDLFFRPHFQRESRDKMIGINPIGMEFLRNHEINFDNNANSNTDERLPEYNMETSMDKTNFGVSNNNDYVDNENVNKDNDPKDISFSEQDAPQDAYNEVYDNIPEWNLPHPVSNSDFSPMTDTSSPAQSHNSIEVPHYYDNDYPYYGDKYFNNKRDREMYLFNGLVRNLGDDSRFAKFYQYKNNRYNRNHGPIVVFVGPPRYQDNEETSLDTKQANSEMENQFINSDGTLLTDINHNVDIPYSPGYHPAFYTDHYLNENRDNNIDEDSNLADKQYYNQVDMPDNNQQYNGMIGSYPFNNDDFDYQRKYYKRNLYNNKDYRYSKYYGDIFKPNRYYRRDPRDFMDDYRYY